MDDDLCFTPAVELARLLHCGELSARELLGAFLNRIHRINPQLNAIVTSMLPAIPRGSSQ